jgi:predicted aconitase
LRSVTEPRKQALELTPSERAQLEGKEGEARRLAMRVVVEMARICGAARLVGVTGAHVDGGLYHGRAGLDFAERLAAAGARVAVPTTLNVGSLDRLHPGLYRGDPATARLARRLMDAYVDMGCRATWTCAPYQLEARPRRGEHIAWAESNAIVFANSVLGARTARYGDFMDICAAITGRVPYAGLHTPSARRARIRFAVERVPRSLFDEDVGYAALGLVVGRRAGDEVPVIEGLPPTATEDQLKALGAAAASSGSVGLFHAVGLTPEAPTLEAATGGAPLARVELSARDLLGEIGALTTTEATRLDAVSVGTPHFSVTEFERLAGLVGGQRVHPEVEFYASTSRAVLEEVRARGWLERLESAGVRIVVDTCTYVTPIIRPGAVVMTNSAKWAYYAPANIGARVVFGTLAECVVSGLRGEVWRDPKQWSGL